MELNFDFAEAARLKLPLHRGVWLVQIGCGGTGSWLAPAVARTARMLTEMGKRAGVVYCDPDAVELKNVFRQNFCQAEVGNNKAAALALRYGTAWGVEVSSVGIKLSKESQSDWNRRLRGLDDINLHECVIVVIGCVDGWQGRRAIEKLVSSCAWGPAGVYWLDCGNEKNSGQVLLGGGNGTSKADPFELPGFCSRLPLPSEQAPDLLEETEISAEPGEALSCAEMALMNAQGLAINQRMAAEAADYLMRMLITQDLRKMATYIDLESGASKSRYITEENVMKGGG